MLVIATILIDAMVLRKSAGDPIQERLCGPTSILKENCRANTRNIENVTYKYIGFRFGMFNYVYELIRFFQKIGIAGFDQNRNSFICGCLCYDREERWNLLCRNTKFRSGVRAASFICARDSDSKY